MTAVRRFLARQARTVRAQPFTSLLALGLTIIAVSLGVRVGCHRQGVRAPQVQVLNGSETESSAQLAAGVLREHGFDVVAIGNADARNYQETLVLVRRGHPGVGRQVAGILGTGAVVEQRDPSLLVDVTVVLGRDYMPPRGAR